MVLKSSICTSALPWQQRFNWGVRMTQNAYFSLLTHTKQLLLVTFRDKLAEIEVRFGRMEWTERTDGTDGTDETDGQTDVRVEIVI